MDNHGVMNMDEHDEKGDHEAQYDDENAETDEHDENNDIDIKSEHILS